MASPRQAPQPKPKQPATYNHSRQLGKAKANEFQFIKDFNRGYRNREDVTTLPQGVLVAGSQNVLTNTFQRVGAVKGFVLDGQRDTSGDPILSSYDWLRHTGDERHLRAGFAVQSALGKLQYRYVASAGDYYNGTTFTDGQVYWIDLMTGLGDLVTPDLLEQSSSTDLVLESGSAGDIELANNGTADASTAKVRFRFAEFWDDTELLSMLLFVNSSSDIFMWTGGVATLKSATSNTLTLSGTDTWAQLGFLTGSTYTRQVLINGTIYSYTGGADTLVLTGVTPDPSGEVVNSVVTQNVVTVANSSITGLPAAFTNYIIKSLDNQVYVSATNRNEVYVSKVGTFMDFTFASPRAVGEGAILTLDSVPTAMIAQEQEMNISAGKDYWYVTQFRLSSDNALEDLSVQRVKTTSRQAAQSQEMTGKIKNNIFFVSFEPVVNQFGTQQNYLLSPQMQDLSFPIVNDLNAYDLTDASVFFFQKFAYVCVPKEGLMRVYNMTDEAALDLSTAAQTKGSNFYWEAPILYSMSLLSVIDGELYGHSYQSSNTFKLFSGYDFDGNTYECIANFSFENSGERHVRKASNSLFVEGYITSNTTLTATLQRELTGGSIADFPISGADTAIVQQPADVASLGKESLGKHSLGGEDVFTNPATNPPKFRVYKTFPRTPYFEEQKRFSSLGVNQVWELVSTGTDAMTTYENPSDITE